MFALIIPWVLLALVISSAAVMLKKKWKTALVLMIALLAINYLFECIPFRFWRNDSSGIENSFKVISFNVEGTSGDYLEKALFLSDFLKEHSPDIVYITEFNERIPQKVDSILSREFAYTTFPDRFLFNYFYGKRPFFNNRKLTDSEGKNVGVYACSTIIQDDTIDLYGCHFTSNNYDAKNKRFHYDEIANKNDAWHYLKDISAASKRRKMEAEALVRELAKSSHRAILMGDLNDVCGSPALKVLESNGLKDCWWERGVGYGATIHKPIPYRIDHIMHTHGLKTEYIRVLDSNGFSDHDALMAIFRTDDD